MYILESLACVKVDGVTRQLALLICQLTLTALRLITFLFAATLCKERGMKLTNSVEGQEEQQQKQEHACAGARKQRSKHSYDFNRLNHQAW